MVPNGWSLKLISDTSKVITGNTPSTKIKEYYGGNIPFVSPADLGGSKHISVATKNLTVEGFKKARSIRTGATLFTCIGSTIGKLGMSATEVATNQQINAVIPHDKFDDDFIYYQLELRAEFIAKLAGTQAVPIINKTTFESQSLLVPDSLPEQRKIAKILSTWDKAISTTERLIDNSKQQKKALMQQLLTGKKRLLDDSGRPFEGEWEEVNLSSLALSGKSNFTDGDWIESPFISESGCRLIQTGNIGVGVFKGKSQKYISESSFHKLKCTEVNIGDLLICRLAEPAGRACVVPDLGEEKMLTSVDVTIMKVDINKSSAEFLSHYFSLEHTLYTVSTLCGGSTRSRVSRTNLGKMKVHLPEVNEQKKITSVLTNADKEIELLEQQLADLKQEKKALMQQLLTGKRRVKVDDEAVA